MRKPGKTALEGSLRSLRDGIDGFTGKENIRSFIMIIKREKYREKYKKRPAGEIRRPIFTSSFDEYLFLFGKFLFVLLRKGEI